MGGIVGEDRCWLDEATYAAARKKRIDRVVWVGGAALVLMMTHEL